MSYAYMRRRREWEPKPSAETTIQTKAPGPDLSSLMRGQAKPSAAQKGTPIDLAGAIRRKMERSFGDLSGVKLYESPTVGLAGAEAMTMGNEIAFAPGMTDFSSHSGQVRLGHELSHVMSQRSGAVRGGGFLEDSSLEAQAEREGNLAASGDPAMGRPAVRAISGASPSPAAVGSMQARKPDENTAPQAGKEPLGTPKRKVIMDDIVRENDPRYNQLSDKQYEVRQEKQGFFAKMFNKKPKYYKARIDRRPWEMTADELQANSANPNNVPELDRLQEELRSAGNDATGSAEEVNGAKNTAAWKTFQNKFLNSETSFARKVKDNDGGKKKKKKDYESWDMSEVDNEFFVNKLSHMARMVRDYPELEGMIGPMTRLTEDEIFNYDENGNKSEQQAYMATSPILKYSDETDNAYETTFPLKMNAIIDAAGPAGEAERVKRINDPDRLNGKKTHLKFAGNHEMGHMLNFLLVKEKNKLKNKENKRDKKGRIIPDSNERYMANALDIHYNDTADDLVQRALKMSMSEEEFNNIPRYQDELKHRTADTPAHKIGQIDFKNSNLGPTENSKGHTTEYGATNAAEFFAEAFADVYQNGENARKTSINLVKLYEADMKKYKRLNAEAEAKKAKK